MRKYIKIILMSVAIVVVILYVVLFVGGHSYTSHIKPSYDSYFNTIKLPIAKYSKGFFTKTFYVKYNENQNSKAFDFTINYLNSTVNFDKESLNRCIDAHYGKKARPFLKSYEFRNFGDHDFFYDLETKSIVIMLLAFKNDDKPRKMIIDLPNGCIKLGLY